MMKKILLILLLLVFFDIVVKGQSYENRSILTDSTIPSKNLNEIHKISKMDSANKYPDKYRYLSLSFFSGLSIGYTQIKNNNNDSANIILILPLGVSERFFSKKRTKRFLDLGYSEDIKVENNKLNILFMISGGYGFIFNNYNLEVAINYGSLIGRKPFQFYDNFISFQYILETQAIPFNIQYLYNLNANKGSFLVGMVFQIGANINHVSGKL